MKISWAFLFVASLVLNVSSYAQTVYKTSQQKCYGFPRVASLKTASDVCVGLVADKRSIAWSFPRKLIFHQGQLYVSAFGGWKKDKGQIWKLSFSSVSSGTRVQATSVLQGTDRTHGLKIGPDGKMYYGDASQIRRFDPNTPDRTEPAVANLPDTFTLSNGTNFGSNHPLKEFTFTDEGHLIVNIGAPSNDCSEEFKLLRTCTQRDTQGEIRLYPYNSVDGTYHETYTVLARGLRNSMGLLYNPNQRELYQAENAADKEGTPDEMNLIEFSQIDQGKDYDFGWPFCYGDGKRYSGYENFKTFCATKADKPFLLMPAHAAPLELIYYQGGMFPELRGSILSSWHGHRPSGSFIVSYDTDNLGRPLKKNPKMVVEGWQASRNHPKGRPVGIAMDGRGALFVVDDANHALLVVAKTNELPIPDDGPKNEAVREKDLQNLILPSKLKEWDETLFPKVIAQRCTICHGDVVAGSSRNTLVNMINRGWINPAVKEMPETQILWQRLNGMNGVRLMPPAPEQNLLDDRAKGNGLYEMFRNWF